jgi:hypothetical protein
MDVVALFIKRGESLFRDIVYGRHKRELNPTGIKKTHHNLELSKCYKLINQTSSTTEKKNYSTS